MRDLVAVMLAAGRGVRMRSPIPKLAHPLSGCLLVEHGLGIVRKLGARRILLVVGKNAPWARALKSERLELVHQQSPLGTAHALAAARRKLSGERGRLIVLSADTPLLAPETLARLLDAQERERACLAVLSGRVADPRGYGRILRDGEGRFQAIREDLDLRARERTIREVNSGVYAGLNPWVLSGLAEIRKNARKGEFYLTDLPAALMRRGGRVVALNFASEEELVGVNTQRDLARASQEMTRRILEKHMRRGVTILDPSKTVIAAGVKIAAGTVIHPFTVIERSVHIGSRATIGPFAKIREGSRIGDGACVGSFVEVVRSRIGKRSCVKHLAYLGDTIVGADVNVGAGTVTANFDGRRKHKTRILDGAQLGCNTVLVAPVRVGKRARTGAGAVVPAGHHVPGGATVAGVPARRIRVKGARRTF